MSEIVSWWVQLAAAIAAGLLVVALVRRSEKTSTWAYEVMDEQEFSEALKAMVNNKWTIPVADMIRAIRTSGDGALRKGHLAWAMNVQLERSALNPVPNFMPPASVPYRIEHDPGASEFRRFLVAKVDGNLLSAYEILHEGASKGSPLAMTSYGVALVKGDVPGRGPDPYATSWLKNAIARSNGGIGCAELGKLLLEGVHVPRDREGGLELMKKACRGGHPLMALDLATVYRQGRHGVPKDEEKALQWGMLLAPAWRVWMRRLGFSQVHWLDKLIEGAGKLEAMQANMSPHARRKLNEELVGNLRGRK